jgi:hypothetical protein
MHEAMKASKEQSLLSSKPAPPYLHLSGIVHRPQILIGLLMLLCPDHLLSVIS